MAQIALVNSGVFFAGYPLGYHFEVSHGVTRWRAMTLRALGRARRWMPVLRQRPLSGVMTRAAIATELPPMAVPTLMAPEAVE
jgi:hypothetical protein